ncbi:MAG: type II toxin-antitoxin system ParD family antitoxin [Marinibacterium sp.]|nr:type II toxin-antitoxin system ParD family antitoxin [Marinibacterium sp.]
MATRNVYLTETDQALIERLISSGKYQSAREVVRAGLRLLEEEQDRREDLSEYMDLLLEEADDPLAMNSELDEAALEQAFDALTESDRAT